MEATLKKRLDTRILFVAVLQVSNIQADTIEGFDIKNKILDLAVASRILSIIRYGDIHAWNALII